MGECSQLETNEVPFSQRPIVILGAGIIGCATARQLLPNELPVEQHGMLLGGSLQINGTFKPSHIAYYSRWLKMTQDGPEAGVSIVNAQEYLAQNPAPDSAIWGKTVVSQFREMSPGEYPPGFNFAWAYETLVTDPTIHMLYLRDRVESLEGRFIRQGVESPGAVRDGPGIMGVHQCQRLIKL